MKAIIKGGLCLALGWLANDAAAQDVIWRAAAPQNSSPVAVVSPPADPAPIAPPSGITLSRPTPLDASGAFAPIVRAQSGEITIDVPRQLPKDGKDFVPPPPQPEASASSPVLGALGMDGCSSSCLPLANGCADRPRFWGSLELLLWWQRGQNVPPLVTSSPAGGPPPVLGLSTTSVLFNNVPDDPRVGGRLTLGMWMPHFGNNLGIEVSYFTLGRQSETEVFTSGGSPQLGRPFFDVSPTNTGANAEVFAGAASSGSVVIRSYNQLWGAEANLRYKWFSGDRCWVDIIGGYRHLDLSEGIDISETAVVKATNLTFVERDSFQTHNEFNGFQLGLDSEYHFWNRAFLGMTAKVAMGDTYQIVNINGSTTFGNVPGIAGTTTVPGGLLALPTNMGRYTSNRFAVAPEVGLKLGVDLTSHLRLFVGYDFLYLSSVLRPGDQIDPLVNDRFRNQGPVNNFLPGVGGGPVRPAVTYQTSGYWAQGVNFGLMYRY
jgi:hypothetical protein